MERNELELLGAIVRQIDLLGWHVKQLRETGSGTVVEEIDGNLDRIKDLLAYVQREHAAKSAPQHAHS